MPGTVHSRFGPPCLLRNPAEARGEGTPESSSFFPAKRSNNSPAMESVRMLRACAVLTAIRSPLFLIGAALLGVVVAGNLGPAADDPLPAVAAETPSEKAIRLALEKPVDI